MEKSIVLGNLSTPEGVKSLTSYLKSAFRDLDIMYSTTAPNGSISAMRGRICLYNNSGTYSLWVNVDGSTTWQQIDADTSLWEVDGTEHQLKTADEIDMQSKKIINLLAGSSALDAVNYTQLDAKAAKGANSDITSLAGLTTPLSIAQGGTGATTLAGAKIATRNAVSYSGNTTVGTAIAHGLGVTPLKYEICAAVYNSSDHGLWISGMGANQANLWGDQVVTTNTAPDTTNIYLTGGNANRSGITYYAVIIA